MKKRLIFLAAAILVFDVFAYAASRQSVMWDNSITIGHVSRKLDPNWRVLESGLASEFYKSSGAPTYNSWKSEFEQIYTTSLSINPFKGFYAETAHEFLGNYAQRYYMSVNDHRRMEMEDVKTKWVRAQARYNTPWFNFELFRGIGSSGWEYEGDMFGFYPESYEQERYRRITGAVVPRGGRLNVIMPVGKLDIIAGDELLWGYGPSIFTKYSFRTGKYNNTLFYKREEIPYGDEGEKLDAMQFVSRFKISRKLGANVGLMYQPFRKGRDYVKAEKTASGGGIQGSGYELKNRETKTIDAFGEAFELYYDPGAFFNQVYMGVMNCGVLAGNVQKVKTGANKYFGSFYGSMEYSYRRPVVDALPLIYEGTSGNPGNIISSPRDKDAPFRVDRDNREANIVELVFSYDPTPKTWFYKWKPDTIEEWNINPAEDAPFASGMVIKFEDYPGATDRMYYYNSSGDIVFEPPFMAGLPPTKRFLTSVKNISVINYNRNRFILELGGGESLAYTVLASDDGRLVTNYFKGSIGHEYGRLKSKISYARDYWGPEEQDWHRIFGFIIDRLYIFNVEYSVLDNTSIFADYLISKRFQNTSVSNDLGSFRQLYAGVNYRFGANLLFEDRRDRRRAVERIRRSRPQIGLAVLETVFSPDGDGVDDYIDFYVDVFSGMVSSWRLVVLNDNDRMVTVMNGRGMPPESMRWDGVDMEYGQTLPEGRYSAYFQITDYHNQTVTADHVEVEVSYSYR